MTLIQPGQQLASDGLPLKVVTLRNSYGTTLQLMDWGASWLSCQFPLSDGSRRELLLGCASPQDYLRQQVYMGATIGRYANRIAYARLLNQGHPIQLAANEGAHQLHGGPDNFSQRRWRILQQTPNQLSLQLESADGDQGFPGHLQVELSYRLTEDNCIQIDYRAWVDRPCPVNLTNHAYFNLDGIESDVRQHRLQLFADDYLPTDMEGIPCAPLTSVTGSGMDFRQPKKLAQDFLLDRDQQIRQGYDHGYLLQAQCRHGQAPAAILDSADGLVRLQLYTTQPALHLYSGNFLAGTPARHGGCYNNFSGVALESEFLPDSPNHPEWPQPDCWLQPGGEYRHTTVYRLSSRSLEQG